MFQSHAAHQEERYFLFKNDYHSGPFTKEQTREMLLKRIVTESDLICLENTEEWFKVEDLFIEPAKAKTEADLPPVIAPPILNRVPEIPSNVSIVQCRACGGQMTKSYAGGRSVAGHGFSLVIKLIFVGIGLLFLLIPIVGWLIGLILILYGLFSSTGARNKKVWKCHNCGTFFERA